MRKIKLYTFLLCSFCSVQSLIAQSAFMPDYFSRSLKIADLTTNTYLGDIAIGSGGNAMAVSPDGSRAYLGYYDFDNETTNTITVIDGKTFSIVKNIFVNSSKPFVVGMDITPDGSKVFFASNDTIYALNTTTLQLDARVGVGLGDRLRGVAVSPDGSKVYAAGNNNIFVLNANTYALEPAIVPTEGRMNQMIVSPDGKTLYCTNWQSAGVHFVDIATGTTKTIGTSTDLYSSLVVTPDNKKLYVTNVGTYTVDVVDIATTSVTSSIAVGASPTGIDISNDGSTVYAINLGDGSLSVISTATNTVTSTIVVGGYCYTLGGFTSTRQVFPVHLGQFMASLSGNNAVLQWKTLNETNTSYFSIERSTDGIHFAPVGKVTASGNSSVAKTYTYNDLNVASLINAKTVYYRLRIVDNDGSSATSTIQPVTLDNKAIVMLLLPNPVKNLLTLTARNFSGKANITVTDVTGRQVLVQNRVFEAGANVSLNVSALQSGTYFIRVEGAGMLAQEKFIKE